MEHFPCGNLTKASNGGRAQFVLALPKIPQVKKKLSHLRKERGRRWSRTGVDEPQVHDYEPNNTRRLFSGNAFEDVCQPANIPIGAKLKRVHR